MVDIGSGQKAAVMAQSRVPTMEAVRGTFIRVAKANYIVGWSGLGGTVQEGCTQRGVRNRAG